MRPFRALAALAVVVPFGAPAAFAQCELTGAWRQTVQPYGASIWAFTALGNGQYQVEEAGFGNSAGTAALNGDRVHVDWRTTDGNNVTGFADWQPMQGCALGAGTQTINGSGVYNAVWERLPIENADVD